ncbi:MAG: 50S ribosomal protein L9 [Phycisphaerales bacterium]|nr:50S ribosomal protein L9 [Phycisphaerales bacterium]
MSQKTELLLTRNVENLGIVGDVVKVRSGFGRNYLLPMGIAEHPTPEKIESLKGARAVAQADLTRVRSERESLIARMEGASVKLVRSCNDQGVLYGAVTQRDIADQLVTDGFAVDMRAVRLTQTIRRVGHYTTMIQFGRDLRVEVAIDVSPDRALDIEMQTRRGHAPVEVEETPQATEAAADAGAKGKDAAEGKSSGKSASKKPHTKKADPKKD